ncbi:MAG: hypothetical protein JWM04_1194 [Verrucomicrobiales bacterium]|nr:hypothetical protein [Verrucomicrobiales bacterium]
MELIFMTSRSKALRFLACLFVVFGMLGRLEAASSGVTIVSFEGKVDIFRNGRAAWTPAQTNINLKLGDKVRTGINSRAVLRISEVSVVRMKELSVFLVQPMSSGTNSSGLNLQQGGSFFFNRDKPSEIQFRTPSASGAIRGTEFELSVLETGETRVALLDGKIAISNNFGSVDLTTLEEAHIPLNGAPVKSPLLNISRVIQWALYYPNVLDPDELDSSTITGPFIEMEKLMRAGNLPKALELVSQNTKANSDSEMLLLASLLLNVGKVTEAEALVAQVKGPLVPQARAITILIATVRNEPGFNTIDGSSTSELLARSYLEQGRFQLAAALTLARRAFQKNPGLAGAAIRTAELEFSMGNTREANLLLKRGLELAPEHAPAYSLLGFLDASAGRYESAEIHFSKAIELDSAFGEAWLGRGLTRIHFHRDVEGWHDLEMAAALEPRRSLFRSYLAKAFSLKNDDAHFRHEIELARTLDPADPTPALYSGLQNQNANRINEAVADVEESSRLNDNRQLFRSRFLLEKDQGIRSASLASIYRDAGMVERSVQEANKSVLSDYLNASSHLFLSESYDALRDPGQINLRYETPWFSELLLANLLAPAGAGVLGQNISQQEYTRFFERDHWGAINRTDYSSHGDWNESFSQFGQFAHFSYSLDGYYHYQRGWRANNDFENTYFTAKIKQDIGEKDLLYLQAEYQQFKGGDLLQYYSQSFANTNIRTREIQEPNLYIGLTHEWSAGNHTLMLLSRLDDQYSVNDPNGVGFTINRKPNGDIISFPLRSFTNVYSRNLEVYSAELQQIINNELNTFLLGARLQIGNHNIHDEFSRNPVAFPPIYPKSGLTQDFRNYLEKHGIYAYDYFKVTDYFTLIGGISYDFIRYPANSYIPPINQRTTSLNQFSPKAGFVLTPGDSTTVRGLYSRALGGAFNDASLRLEPSELAGFVQSYRTLIPESISGTVSGTKFDVFGLGLDQMLWKGAYLTADAQLLESSADRDIGVFDFTTFSLAATPSATPERLIFREHSASVAFNQLIGSEWSFGASYRASRADLDDRFSALPATASPIAQHDYSGILQQGNLYGIYTLPCGFFAGAEAHWYKQHNFGFGFMPGDDFWHYNAFAGYRFPHRQAELRVALLNIGNRDYRLNPINLYNEVPHERTVVVSLKFNF